MSELIDEACNTMDLAIAELDRLRKLNETLLSALVQAKGALILDHMVDRQGRPYGTTIVALEAIDAAFMADAADRAAIAA